MTNKIQEIKGPIDEANCPICDYWWVIWLVLLAGIALITQGYLLPMSSKGFTATATERGHLSSVSTETPVVWKHFDGTGYTLDYPASWYAYHDQTKSVDTPSVNYDLILSDAPGNQSPQSSTEDEQARITIIYLPKLDQPLELWVVERWAWLNTDILSTKLFGLPVLTATLNSTDPISQHHFYWLEHRDYFYIIQTDNRGDIQARLQTIEDVIASIVFDK